MVGNGHDLVWVSGNPARNGSASNTAPREQLKPKPKAERGSKQQLQTVAMSAASENVVASNNVDPNTINLTFSQLSQEDKNKIGALIRKLITLKAEYSQEAENVKQEKMKFDQELQSIQQHNQKIKQQTKELKTHFSSSLALLKIYKEKVHRQESEKADKDRQINDLMKELENMRQEQEMLRATCSIQQESEQTELGENIPRDASEIKVIGTKRDSINSARLVQQNQRLQRLLEIQNFSRASRPAMETKKQDLSDETSCEINEEPEILKSPHQTICRNCLQHERSPQPNASVIERRMDSFLSTNTIKLSTSNDEDESDDEQILIKELNSHREHAETLLYLHNDVSLVQALENINMNGQDDLSLHNVDYRTDSDDDQFLQAITKDLNTKRAEQCSDRNTSGFT